MYPVCEPLASAALPHDILGLLQSGRPIESVPEHLCDQGSGRSVMPAFTLMYFQQHVLPFFWFHTSLKDTSDAALV
jgi:hypothetical protein